MKAPQVISPDPPPKVDNLGDLDLDAITVTPRLKSRVVKGRMPEHLRDFQVDYPPDGALFQTRGRDNPPPERASTPADSHEVSVRPVIAGHSEASYEFSPLSEVSTVFRGTRACHGNIFSGSELGQESTKTLASPIHINHQFNVFLREVGENNPQFTPLRNLKKAIQSCYVNAKNLNILIKGEISPSVKDIVFQNCNLYS